ncbi:DUF2637 domain-containing protein [Streptomyces sp. NPDC052236]|uniref:DUF2637 domain-containing protein n=1 Tax=Streptomyces sp. NPDC052236 TaxID=3365686 RepID=UPI0037CE766F
MPHPTATAPAAITGTAAIRLGIALLGAIGFALSYDALRQMAVAIHIRGLLTYAFPLVIDGFIAIGVGALLILRTAPLPSRLYVWALVGLATATSIWANALHAIRLNQQTRHTGLHLDDLTVGALSAIAPLALAGAVHLYLVIRRHPTPRNLHPPEDATAHRHIDTPPGGDDMVRRQRLAHPAGEPSRQESAPKSPAADVADSAADVAEVAHDVPDAPDTSTKAKGRQPSATMDQLLSIGRTAARGRDGRISRRNVEAAVRAQGYSVGRNRLDEARLALQAELDKAPVGAR